MDKFKEELADILLEDEIFDDRELRSFGEWGSLSALSVIALVDEMFEVLLTGNDIKNCITIGDLLELIEKKR